MGRQRKACLRAVRKLQWDLRRELASETPPTMPLLMRPAVKEILIGAERGEFNTLLIGSPEDLLCEPQELEALLSVLSAHDIHVFGCQRGRWVEPGGGTLHRCPGCPGRKRMSLPPVEGVSHETLFSQMGPVAGGTGDFAGGCGHRAVLAAGQRRVGGGCRNPETAAVSLPVTVAAPNPRLADAHAANADSVAWLTIPGTNIDAPVQQADDNDYYLRRNAAGEYDEHGSLYADYDCDLSSAATLPRNLVIYGHTFDEELKDSFGQLHNYRVYEFGQEHPYIYLSTLR